jgi:hypothetical protein
MQPLAKQQMLSGAYVGAASIAVLPLRTPPRFDTGDAKLLVLWATLSFAYVSTHIPPVMIVLQIMPSSHFLWAHASMQSYVL